MGIPFCFGDDSHAVEEVGADVDLARAYFLENGITSVTCLAREEDAIVRRVCPLAE